MASPVAHSLAGAIIYFAFRPRREWRAQELAWTLLAANLADLDLVPGLLIGAHALFHRTLSHSLLGAGVFALLVLLVCRWRGTTQPSRTTLLLFAAYLSQILLDWLSLDIGPPRGLPLFWPLSSEHYMADPPVFLNIERSSPFTLPVIIHNTKAVLLEAGLLGPIALMAWWWRHRELPRGAPQRQRS